MPEYIVLAIVTSLINDTGVHSMHSILGGSTYIGVGYRTGVGHTVFSFSLSGNRPKR